MPHGCTNTIITGIATTNHDDIFSFGIDVSVVFQFRVQKGFRIELKQVNREQIYTESSVPAGIPWRSERHRRFGLES